MKVVHVITSLERGGAQAVLEILISALAEQGHEQAVIYMHDGPYRQIFQQMGVPVYKVAGLISSFDPASFYRFYRLIKKIKPDTIHSLLWGANLMARAVARILTIPCVLSLHNNLDQNGFIRNSIDRLVSYQGHSIVAVSDEVKASLYRYQPATLAVEVIQNGIDHELLGTIKPLSRETVGLSEHHFVIGSVGRFVAIKRYFLLLDVMAELLKECSHARLVLVGSGSQEKELRDYAATLGIAHAVSWIIDQPALPYYQLFNCFAQTSYQEGISMALLEAMSFGVCPIVTYHKPTHPIISDMQNGFVAYQKNATDIAALLIGLANDHLLRKKLAQRARHDALSLFSKKRMIAAYLALFESTLQR